MGVFDRLTHRELEPFAMIALNRIDSEGDGLEAAGERRRERRERGLYAVVNRNWEMREAYAVFAKQRFEEDAASGVLTIAADEPPAGRFQRFMQWILDHREEIIAFIKMIIGLFSGVPVAAAFQTLASASPSEAAQPMQAQALWNHPLDIGLAMGILEGFEAVRGTLNDACSRLKAGIDSVRKAA